jgi:hypothetical protein
MYVLYFSISLVLRMEDHQLRIRTTVLFVNISSSLSCRNLGSSGPMIHHLVIHPVVVMRTDCAFKHLDPVECKERNC